MDPGLTKVNRFVVERCLGVGGMGEVYLAYDPKLKRQVAVKRIAPHREHNPAERAHFLEEAQRMTALEEHPNITTVYDIIEEDDRLFIVMEYINGSNLRDRLQQPISFDEFLNIALQCAGSLECAHGKGIAHGDLKPANIMLTRAGEVKICDFGLARYFPQDEQTTVRDSILLAGPITGTPGYMAPEVLRGRRADARSDIFSLGIVLYEMLTGRNPFWGPDLASTANRILYAEPEAISSLMPKVSVDAEAIVFRMLRKEPDSRPTAHEVSLELSRLPHATTRVSNVEEEVHHLVVLPFSAIAEDPEKLAFGNGLTETLTTRLAKLTLNSKNLQIISASEVRLRRIHQPDEALKELGANVVLTGGLQWAGRRLRISVCLIETRTHKQLHADLFDIEASDVFETQDRIADQILRTFHLETKNQLAETLMEARATQPGAYEFYLQGRGYLQHYHKPEKLESAIAVFERALAIDPEFALAHAGLGETYWRKYELSKAAEWVKKSRMSCEKAMLLEPNLADAQAAIGMIFNGTGEYESAVLAFRRAIARDPASDSYYGGLAFAYEQLGRNDEAEASYRAAISVRPYNWIGYNNLGKYFFNRGRHAEAIEMFKHVVALVPDSFPGYSSLGVAYYALHRTDEAIRALEKSMELRLTYAAASNLGTIYFYEERYDYAVEAYRKALSLNDKEYRVWGNLGSALRWLGNAAESREAYERAIRLVEAEIEINPRSATILAFLADYCAGAGHSERGRALIEDALHLGPDNTAVLYRAASLFEDNLGERDRALECVRKAFRLGLPVDQILRNPSFKKLREDPRFNTIASPISGRRKNSDD